MKIKNKYLNKMIKKCYMCKSNTFRDQRCVSEFGNPNTDVDCYNPHEKVGINEPNIYIDYGGKIYYSPLLLTTDPSFRKAYDEKYNIDK